MNHDRSEAQDTDRKPVAASAALSDDQRRAFLRAEVLRTPRVIREWLGAERLERHLRTWIDRHLSPRDGRSEAFIVHTPMGEALACRAEAQRHGAMPLVEIIAMGFLPNSNAELRTLADTALAAVPGEHDDKVRLLWWNDAPWQPHYETSAAESGVKVGKALFAMPIDRVVDLPPPPGRERVRMTVPRDLGFYDEYAREYLTWMEAAPHLSDFVRLETRADMEEFLASGLLALAEFEGPHGWQVGGVMAARADRHVLGLGGVQTAEEFIYAPFRGQGLAAPMQRAYVDLLASLGLGTDQGCIIGWIHHINDASRRTALKVGRLELGHQVLVRPKP